MSGNTKKSIRKRHRWQIAKDWATCSAEDGEWWELDIRDTEDGTKITVSIPQPNAEGEDDACEAGERLATKIRDMLEGMES